MSLCEIVSRLGVDPDVKTVSRVMQISQASRKQARSVQAALPRKHLPTLDLSAQCVFSKALNGH